MPSLAPCTSILRDSWFPPIRTHTFASPSGEWIAMGARTGAAHVARMACATFPGLGVAERARLHQIASPRERVHFLVSRFLLRRAAGQLTGCAPDLVTIEEDHSAAPRIESPARRDRIIEGSVSHSSGHIYVAASTTGKVGIDVEVARRCHLEVINRAMSESERRAVLRQPTSRRQQALCHLWTVKEACAKATDGGAPFRLIPASLSPSGSWGRLRWWTCPAWNDAVVALAFIPWET